MKTIYAFVDKEFGLSFAGKRPTYDRAAMIEMMSECPNLTCDEYSIAKLRSVAIENDTPGLIDKLQLAKSFCKMKLAKNVFVETQTEEQLKELTKRAKRLVLFMWDAEYPHTVSFPLEDDNGGYQWQLDSAVSFKGSTHENMLILRYSRKK